MYACLKIDSKPLVLTCVLDKTFFVKKFQMNHKCITFGTRADFFSTRIGRFESFIFMANGTI